MRWLLIGCLVLPVGLVALVALGFLSIGMLGQKASTKFETPSPSAMPVISEHEMAESLRTAERLEKSLGEWDLAQRRGLRGRQLLPYDEAVIRDYRAAIMAERSIASHSPTMAEEKKAVEGARKRVKEMEKGLESFLKMYDQDAGR